MFDIKELAVYDGPGIRTTVFLKGCPLRCSWCHNPEGLSPRPQVMVNASACLHCGKCRVEGCALIDTGVCSGCGKCLRLCPGGYRKISGSIYTPEALTERLMRVSAMYGSDGGVTFSGGEPTLQHEFLAAVLDLLRKGMDESGRRFTLGMQTCGYCGGEVFADIVRRLDFLFFDIKHTDSDAHRRYTGVSNELILSNLRRLGELGVPFIARLPLIPGVNDSPGDMEAAARLLDTPDLRRCLIRVELLPYNMAAGAKYSMVGRSYEPDFDEGTPRVDLNPFTARGMDAAVL